MRKRTIFYIITGIIVALIIAGIAVTLVLVLKKDDKKDSNSSLTPSSTMSTTLLLTTTPPSIDDEISLNSTFPNGSSIIHVTELSQGSIAYSPLEVNITELNEIGINVDNSSLVAETGRQSFFYIRLPPSLPSTTAGYQTLASNKRDIDDDPYNLGNIGIQFGNSSIINVIPLSLTNQFDSGLSIVGQMSDMSTIYLLKIRMAESMCAGAIEGACSVISWKPYSISNSMSGSPGNFNTALPVACGSQCDVAATSACASSSCTSCDGQQVAGADTPVTRRYKMGKNNGTILFLYQTYSVPDRITITYENKMIFDSKCIGTESEQQTTVTWAGHSQELRIDVEPNCDGTTGTAWYFTVPCLPTCSFSKDNSLVQLISDQKVVQNGDTIYITDEPQMPPLTAKYCVDPNSPATISWNFTLVYDYVICKKSTGNGCSSQENRNCTVSYQHSSLTWDIAQEFGSKISGGYATLSWNDSKNNAGKITFNIFGINPKPSDVQSYIATTSPPWYAVYIAQWESKYTQFQASGEPMYSFDYGYGIYQLTIPEPKCDDIWNWKHSVNTGITVIHQKIKIASDWMKRQRGQAFNNTGHAVPVPCLKVKNCVFQESTSEVIDDAVAIKAFNGAPLHYCAWNNAQKCWYFVVVDNNNRNYVENVCSQVPATLKTCPSPDPYANNLCSSN